VSDRDDIAARRKAERERLRREHYQKEIQAAHQDKQDVQSDASFLEGAFDLLGADTLSDIESAAPYAQTPADRAVLDAFIKQARKGRRGWGARSIDRKARKARKAYKTAKTAKKKKGCMGAVALLAALGGSFGTVVFEGVRIIARA
jgi:hypothetical protein